MFEGRPILILGLLWQIIRMQLLSQISIKNYPELVLLLDEGKQEDHVVVVVVVVDDDDDNVTYNIVGEELASLLKLTPEDILLRWFNYHLKRGGICNYIYDD